MTGPTLDTRHVALSMILGLAVVGFFVGTGSPPEGPGPLATPRAPEGAGQAPPALSYSALRGAPRGPDAGLSADLARLDALDPGAEDTGDRALALARRAASRAYDGAPPTIPHPIRQRAVAECLACHAEGLRLRGRLAPAMPHAELASCTQCHVVSDAPMPGEALPPDRSSGEGGFVGLASPGFGPRAWDIAPPQVPHPSVMREVCTSCHGPRGRSPLRSSHPDQQSCTQCHAPSAELDRRPGLP